LTNLQDARADRPTRHTTPVQGLCREGNIDKQLSNKRDD